MKRINVFIVMIVVTFLLNLAGIARVSSTDEITHRMSIKELTNENAKPIEREMKSDEIHLYKLSLQTGQFVQAVVDQHGIDVIVTVFDPGKKKIYEIDSPNGRQGPEPVSFEAESSGIYQLEVKSLEDGAEGRYEVKIEKILSPEENAERIAKLEPYCESCEKLKNLELPDVIISNTENVVDAHPHCKISGTIGKEIKFELLLPFEWNARYIMAGSGGFAGRIPQLKGRRLNAGYAVSGTDTGHEGNMVHADWALNNMERQVNYAYLAVHRTATVSKAIINEYYGQSPDYSYFIGCSNGGRQAMMEAQRYPEDFDGIVAGAPSMNLFSLCAKFLKNSQIMFPDPHNLNVGVLSPAQLKILQEAVLEQCDEIDGIKDNIINDPRSCQFDFSVLPKYSEGLKDTVCFTADQIEAIQMLLGELRIQGQEIFPGCPVGSEDSYWGDWLVGPNESVIARFGFPTLQYGFSTEWFKYIIYEDPEWDYSMYDFLNYLNDSKLAHHTFDATSTDYSEFNKNDGKLIIWHGWNDAAVSANITIKYFEAVKESDPFVDDYLRLYLLPGVDHCGGGPGPDEVDWLEILRNWVEKGNAPERIVLSKTVNGETVMTRPVYPYPMVAVYDGFGDPNLESSFIVKK